MFKLLMMSTITLFFVGCGATKMQIQAVKPAETNVIKNGSSLAVVDFKNEYDSSLSSKVESSLVNKNLENNNYFTVVSRQDISNVMKEQRLQGSDMFDSKTAVRFGKIIGADILVSGNVSKSGKNDSYMRYYKTCAKYSKEKGECIRYERHSERCFTVNASVQATINLLNVERGTIDYSKNYSQNIDSDTCKYGRDVKDKDTAINMMIDTIANDFTKRITPSKVYSYIELMEDVDFDLNDKQEQMFENGIEYIKQGRVSRAKDIFENLNYETGNRSYEIIYNNGVIAESQGDLQKALQFYLMSDKVVPSPNELISRAIIRTKSNIQAAEKVKSQTK